MLLTLSPHPDDLELSAGLLCHRALECGWRVTEIVMTDGGMGGTDPAQLGKPEHIRQRRLETLAAAGVLGGVSVHFFDAPDLQLRTRYAQGVEFFKCQLSRLRPDVICYPSIRDRHIDHRVTHLLTARALGEYTQDEKPIELQYCFWGKDERANIRLRHPQGRDAKVRAAQAHRSQPIDKYLSLLKRADETEDFLAFEFFYAPYPDDASRLLLNSGFEIKVLGDSSSHSDSFTMHAVGPAP